MSALSTMVDKRRRRRSGAEIEALREAIEAAVAQDSPTTCRSIFYRLVSAGAIAKTEREYKNVVVRLVKEMRLAERIPWRSITDGTRLRRKPDTFDSLGDALEDTRRFYRRALWRNQPAYVEVWSEKDAISGVVSPITWEWDVPLLVCRGYPSLTYLHNAAEEIAAQGKPAWIYYLGDHDPSGIDISRNVEARLREFAPDADIRFVRLAVTREQITRFSLSTRPTKSSDSRSRGFKGESVEVDAIPPDELRYIVEAAITHHVDQSALDRMRGIELAERESLNGLIGAFRRGATS